MGKLPIMRLAGGQPERLGLHLSQRHLSATVSPLDALTFGVAGSDPAG